MNEATSISERRYRRRIAGLGAFAFVLTFAVGAAIALPGVEADLEERVSDELVAAGLDGVSISFSGQDGVLRCSTSPRGDVDLVAIASDVNGVRAIELDQSCADRASSPADDGSDATASTETADATSSDESAVDSSPPTDPTDAPTSTATAENDEALESILDVVDRDPLFGTLTGLLVDAGLTGTDELGGDGPFTLLAPTDEAFDAAFDEIGADAFQDLLDDRERLRTLLLHHVVEGSFESADLVPGPLAMLDGTSVEVDTDPDTRIIRFTSGESRASVDDPLTQLDIDTSNGTIHAVDRLLVPVGLEFGADPQPEPLVAVLSGGSMAVGGTIASADQRTVVLVAASLVDAAALSDGLTIDVDSEIADGEVELFGRAVGALSSMISGEVRLVEGEVSVSGVATDAFSAAVLDDFGADNDVSVDVSVPVVGGAEEAAELQDELNALVLERPLVFEPGSAEIDPASNEVLADIAERALSLDGVTIQVVGHTDTGETPSLNLALSQDRAEAVRFLLVVLGLDADTVTALGVGGADPVIIDGEEDQEASRRVQFVVEAAAQ